MRFSSSRSFRVVAIFGLLLTLSSRASAGPVFTFDDPTQLSPTVQTEDGLTATFGSPAGPGGILIGPSTFRAPFSGNALFNNGVTSNTTVPITATFSKSVYGVSVDFGTLTSLGTSSSVTPTTLGTSSSVTLEAFSGGLNGTLVGTVTAKGVGQVVGAKNTGGMTPDFMMLTDPQGVLSFSSNTPFDTIEIFAAPGVTFAIDNLVVNLTVPEPAGLTLAGLTLVALSIRARKRRAAEASPL
jgi:hypothetical protein